LSYGQARPALLCAIPNPECAGDRLALSNGLAITVSCLHEFKKYIILFFLKWTCLKETEITKHHTALARTLIRRHFCESWHCRPERETLAVVDQNILLLSGLDS
jgi:hypothetical protein